MAVLLETSIGEVVVDLRVDEAPIAAKNFLKLCKIKYYNGCLFYNVQVSHSPLLCPLCVILCAAKPRGPDWRPYRNRERG